MATPFHHAHVSHVTRKGRRRSQSLSLPKDDPDNVLGLNSQQKQFLAQLQKIRQKELKANKEEIESIGDEENDRKQHRQPVITQVNEIASPSTAKNVSTSIKKHRPTTTEMKSVSTKNEDDSRPVITKVSRAETTKSTKNLLKSEELQSPAGHHDFDLSPNDIDHDLADEPLSKSHPQIVRAPRRDSAVSIGKATLSKPKTGNITVSPASKSSNLDSSNGSAYPFLSSSKNLMSRSEIFDQDSLPTDEVPNGKYKKITISGSGNGNGNAKFYDEKVVARSSASLMTAVISTILGVIAFAFGLTALILVQRLRSTVESELAASKTTTQPKYSSGWQTACSPSTYTLVDDATRSVRAAGYALGCDDTTPFINRTTAIWIRFSGTGGTQLPLTTPGMNICGTEGTGYFVGTMPSDGELLNATACFTWYNSVCRFSVSISVANCGSYYVYYLPPAPACMMRYCTI